MENRQEKRESLTITMLPSIKEAGREAAHHLRCDLVDVIELAMKEWLERNFPSAGGENALQSPRLTVKQEQILQDARWLLLNAEPKHVKFLTDTVALLLHMENTK